MNRREFLQWCSTALLSTPLAASGRALDDAGRTRRGTRATGAGAPDQRPRPLFLAGDVMTGRGIDQILPHSVDPQLHEPHATSATTYVEMAERESGPIPEDVSFDYVWGEALEELTRVDPDVRIVNLETAVTTSDEWWRGKSVHYRMHPRNVKVLSVAGIDVCVLGNNHALDWGTAGLRETLRTLQEEGLHTAGAGLDRTAAAAPAALETRAGRVLVFSYGAISAGVPSPWRAAADRPGVHLLPTLRPEHADQIIDHVRSHRREDDRVVVSLHWGPNWGYAVPDAQRKFARRLVDAGVADVLHGHSSHHPKGIEVYRGRPILYGAGDLLNDYEGVGGRRRFRSELTLLYFPRLDRSGRLVSFEMTPMRIRRFRLQRASAEETRWLAERLDRECRPLGTQVEETEEGRLALRWDD